MARAKKADGAKKRVKDLDPKGKAKNVKGGRRTLGDDVNRVMNRDANRIVNRDADRIVNRVADGIDGAARPR